MLSSILAASIASKLIPKLNNLKFASLKLQQHLFWKLELLMLCMRSSCRVLVQIRKQLTNSIHISMSNSRKRQVGCSGSISPLSIVTCICKHQLIILRFEVHGAFNFVQIQNLYGITNEINLQLRFRLQHSIQIFSMIYGQ